MFSNHAGLTEQQIVRAQVTIDAAPSETFSYLKNPFNKREFDKILGTLEVIEEFGDIKCIFYQNNLPWPLNPREAIYAEGNCIEQDGTMYVLSRSIPADEVPTDEGFVRANIMLYGHVIKPTPQGFSFLTSYFYIDPLGSVPSSTKINAGKLQAETMATMKKKIENL